MIEMSAERAAEIIENFAEFYEFAYTHPEPELVEAMEYAVNTLRYKARTEENF